jgi:glutamate synthase (NADPH/NADH) large chain
VSECIAEELRGLVVRHHEETGSDVAATLLADWPGTVARLTEVMPRDYRRVLDARADAERDGLSGDDIDKRIMEVLHG